MVISILQAGRDVPLAAMHIYQLSFFTGFGVSAIIYYLLNLGFPVPGKADKFEEVDESCCVEGVLVETTSVAPIKISEDDSDVSKKYGDGEPKDVDSV